MRPLEGIRILDFTHVLAGPFATRILADMGADVVKVNSAARMGMNGAAGPYYPTWNRNKRALALDMSHEEARAIGKRLALEADVVIDNFSVGVLDRWGMGFEDVSSKNSGVIYLQMSGMGEGGPWSNFVTFAPTIHALSGLTRLTGVPGREDIGIGFSYNDHVAGLHGATAILSAIEARRRSGQGQRIDLSQFEVGVNLLGPALMDFFVNGVEAQPVGNKLPYDKTAPHGCYRCAGAISDSVVDERWIAIACLSEVHWEKLVEVMDRPEWASDSRFSSASRRWQHSDALDALISDWTKDHDALQLMGICQSAGVPAGVMQNGKDLVENDPQLRASEFVMKLGENDPLVGNVFADRLPIEFSKTPCNTYRPAQPVGTDNADVLNDWLDLSSDEVRQGEEAGHFV